MPQRLPLLAPVALAIVASGCGAYSLQADIVVRVVDGRTGAPVGNAAVQANYEVHRTAPNGTTRFSLRPDGYELTVEHPAYLQTTTSIAVIGGVVSNKTVALVPRPAGPQPGPGTGPGTGPSTAPSAGPSGAPASPGASGAPAAKGATLYGRVTDRAGTRIAGATIFVESAWGIPQGSATTNAVGEYKVAGLPEKEPARVTVIATGYESVTRAVTPAGSWKLDFTGYNGLARPAAATPEPGGPAVVAVVGRVEDTMGRAIDGAIVRAESDNTRYPYTETAVVRQGRFTMKAPAEIAIKFTATKVAHRPVTFVQRLEKGAEGRVSFTGNRALDPSPVLEGG